MKINIKKAPIRSDVFSAFSAVFCLCPKSVIISTLICIDFLQTNHKFAFDFQNEQAFCDRQKLSTHRKTIQRQKKYTLSRQSAVALVYFVKPVANQSDQRVTTSVYH